LFGQQLVWPLPRQQLIKNSIFISPIIHFDFIVEWMALGGRAAVGFWSDWSGWVAVGWPTARRTIPKCLLSCTLISMALSLWLSPSAFQRRQFDILFK